jgi:tetratricopeptide (TPR) repeat protein
VVARIAGIPTLFEAVRTIAELVLASPSAVPLAVHMARTAQALLAVQRGDVALAAEQYPALEPQRGTMAYEGYISNDRVLGLLAQTMGDLDKAAEHFEDALTFCRKAGYRPELAWACCDYADWLLHRVGAQSRQVGTPLQDTDRRKAMALLDEALNISRELGMRPLMERVLARRQILRA